MWREETHLFQCHLQQYLLFLCVALKGPSRKINAFSSSTDWLQTPEGHSCWNSYWEIATRCQSVQIENVNLFFFVVTRNHIVFFNLQMIILLFWSYILPLSFIVLTTHKCKFISRLMMQVHVNMVFLFIYLFLHFSRLAKIQYVLKQYLNIVFERNNQVTMKLIRCSK